MSGAVSAAPASALHARRRPPRWFGVALLALAPGIAASSLLGPLGARSIRCRPLLRES